MAVIYDNSSVGLQASGIVSLTFSFNNVSGNALVVGVGGFWPSGSKPNSSGAFITYNGVKFVQTVNNVEMSSNGTVNVASYVGGYLMDPATGSQDVVITMQSSTLVIWLNAIVMSVNGATGTPNFKSLFTGNSLSTSRSISLDTQNNGVVACIALLNGASLGNASWSSDASERIAATYVSPWVLKGVTKTTTYPSTTITWNNTDGPSLARTSVLMAFAFPPREIILSPTYYYNFQNDTTGYMANEFTAYSNWYRGSTLDVRTVPGETSEKAISIIKGDYGMEHAYNNTIGKLTLNDQPIEVATKFKYQYTDLRSDAVPTDFMTTGIISEDGSGTGIGFSLRYGYADVFRIQIYSNQQAETSAITRKWKSEGIITCSTSSNIVTGAIDPAKPPYNFWFNSYPAYFIVGEYYQIMKLGSSDWNTVANTTGITYKVGDIVLCVNKGTGDGEGFRKTTTRFQDLGIWSDPTYVAKDSDIEPLATLYHIDGTEIGTIQSIESATSLTLTTNAKINATGVQFKMHPDSFVPMSNTWYYIRFRRDVDGTYKSKIWPTSGYEPERWLLDSTPNKGQYDHNLIDERFTTGRLGVTTFARGNYYWAQWGASLDVGGASLDGTFPPSITSVDTDNIITSAQTNITVIGYHLTGVTTATIVQGTTSIPQSATIVSDTTATFSIAFDTNTYDVKYGTAVLRFESPTGRGNKSITVIPPDNRCYRDLTSINVTAENRLTALPDLDIGDQIEVLSVVGGSMSDVNINSDATFDAISSVTSFTCRAWSSGQWGSPAVQSMVAAAIRRRVIIIS